MKTLLEQAASGRITIGGLCDLIRRLLSVYESWMGWRLMSDRAGVQRMRTESLRVPMLADEVQIYAIEPGEGWKPGRIVYLDVVNEEPRGVQFSIVLETGRLCLANVPERTIRQAAEMLYHARMHEMAMGLDTPLDSLAAEFRSWSGWDGDFREAARFILRPCLPGMKGFRSRVMSTSEVEAFKRRQAEIDRCWRT